MASPQLTKSKAMTRLPPSTHLTCMRLASMDQGALGVTGTGMPLAEAYSSRSLRPLKRL